MFELKIFILKDVKIYIFASILDLISSTKKKRKIYITENKALPISFANS